jgi:preprotein translocase subunit SecE
LDRLILMFAVLPLAGSIGAFYYYGDESLLFRVIGILVAAGISLFIASRTGPGQTALVFVRDARIEVRKVVWPTRKETVQTTLFVLVAVFIMGFCLWLLDMFLAWAVRFLTV